MSTTTVTADCDLYNDALDDVLLHDDTAERSSCQGKSTGIFFYILAIFGAGIGAVMSLRFNFPGDGAAVSYKGGHLDEQKLDSFASDERHSVNRGLSREVPVASTLFRFRSYFYEEGNEADDHLLGDSNVNSLNEKLIRNTWKNTVT